MSEVADIRILRVTRWLVYLIMGLIAAVGVILAFASVVMPFHWTKAVAEILKEHPGMDTSTLLPHLYIVFALIIVIMGIVWTIMRKLLAIIGSVEQGNPFVLANAIRLRAIGWLMVVAQFVAVPLAIMAGETADLFGKNNVDFDLSLNSLLAILLVFILSGIFQRGAQMREELEGTV
jgi:hypothetical protein